MSSDPFADTLQALRPRLHRYCAGMTGSSIDGEDAVQDTLVKALRARADGTEVVNLEAWLFSIAHTTCLDWLRRRARRPVVPLSPELAVAAPEEDPGSVTVGFRTFLRLPELQRCAVILKDVLGHSVEDVAAVAGCSVPAAKSALQRGRAALRALAALPEDTRVPLMTAAERDTLATYVRLFQSGEFDAIRAMLAEEVKLDLVNRLRLDGKLAIGRYFTRYAEETRWRFALGAVEGRPAMLVFDVAAPATPAHFVLLDWQDERIATIRDFLFAPYVMSAAEWTRLG